MTPPPSSLPWATAGSPDRASPGSKQGGGLLDNPDPSLNDHATQMSQNAPGRLLADKADDRSLREKFNVDSQMGGLSLSIPIQTSLGRSGFGPVLSLEYNSGSANSNGVFGLGWSLAGVDRISRKTTVAIPTYDDDEDIFVHSGVGDLVPVMQAGEKKPVERDEKAAGVEYRVRSYRSRVESTPLRVEYWRCPGSPGKSHWKVMASGGVTAIFGSDTSSQISSHRKVDGSEEPNLIFSWLVSEIYDSKGNHMVFSYKRESPDALAEQLRQKVYEAQRNVTSERYLKSIKYGNQRPNRNKDNWAELLPVPPEDPWHWMFEVVFDYGEHPGDSPTIQEATAGWALRPDPFSNYTSGIEVRTHRRCQRVLMFHHFKELGRQDCLVAATEFKYQVDAKSGASILQSSTPCGYQLDESGKKLSSHRLPSSDFEYWQVPNMADVPIEEFQLDLSGFSTPSVQWVDLNGDGAPGILSRVPGGGWYYHQSDGGDAPAFSGPSLLQRVPSLGDSDDWSFEDLTGDGHLDVALVSSKGDDIRGFYEHKGGAEWSDFVPFQSFPVGYSASDPAVHKVDLVGNGCADLLRLELQSDNEFAWYPSLGREGYGSEKRTKGAPGLPSAPTNLIVLCDMVGDGLSDMVLLSSSHICYWPNMGHGLFGPQVTMANAPFLADYASFSPQRIRMVDITGTGTADLVYLPPEGGVRVYYNQFGNSWSDAHYLATFPALDNTCLVDVLDIGARGTQCLCWISDYTNRGPGSTTVRFLDLTGGSKPGLLKKRLNGVGGQIEVTYRSSTQYYNEDRCAGEQWTTRLPFPVHCVERVITTDVVAQTTHTMRYAYHNGYYDPFDRQFRGFQMVEEWDAEDFVTGAASAGKFQRPPVHTKTWYYVGSEPVDAKTVLPKCFLTDQPQQAPLSAAKISAVKGVGAELIAAEVLDAYRALAGQQRRQEIFSADGSSRSSSPYLISQQTHEVLMYQGIPQGQRYGIFRVNDREELTCHYERDLKEALVQHSLTLQTDQYGNVCKQVVVHYGKLSSELAGVEDQKKQKETVVLYEETRHTNSIDPLLSPALDAHDYFQVPLPSDVRHFRVLPGSSWACSASGRYSWETLSMSLSGVQELEIHETAPGSSEKGVAVLVSKSRTLYSRKDLTGPVPLHKLEPYSIEYQSYQLVFNHKMLEAGLKDGGTPLLNSKDLVDELSKGCYVQLSGEDSRGDEWWVPSSRRLFKDRSDDDSPKSSLSAARLHFYISNAEIDPFGNVSHKELDDYKLLATKSIDAAKNTTLFTNSYIHLLPNLVTDVNGNRTQTIFDACGRPLGVAVLGKAQEALGDTLDGFVIEPSQELLKRFIADPSGPAATQLLGNAGRRFIYHDRLEGATTQAPQRMVPSFQAELVRDMHHKDESGKAIPCQIAVKLTYFDGHGQVIQQASLSGSEKPTEKWRLSGWVIRDNKRQPVKQFLPSAAATHSFRAQADGSLAPATIFLRDPLDRLVSVVNADHTWTKTRFDAWKQVQYDEGDTVTIDDPATDSDVGSHFAMLERQSYSPVWLKDAKTAAEAVSKSRVYGDTPTTSHTDVLGRQIVVESDNGRPEGGKPKDKRIMRRDYDLRGNVVQLRDELDRVVSKIYYDLLGRPLNSISMDSGSRWSLPDCQGSPFLSWTSRGNQQRIVYDKLRRVECVKVRPLHSSPEVTMVKNVYGETRTDALKNNLKGKLYQCFDQSGVRTNKRFDFRGNCVESSHKYAVEYRETLDWSKETNALETDDFSTKSSFNAVGLVLHVKDMKDDSEESVLRTYDVAGRIKTLKSLTKDEKTVTSSVDDVQYDEDDKITAIAYGNGSLTTHEYDVKTRRLVRTITKRTKDKATLEDITYTYDCVGKVVKKTDSSQQTVYFDGEVVSPSQEYRYNSLGQLIEATGREQVDINNGGQKRLRPYDMSSRNNSIPGDGRQMIQYIETYEYDLGGNMRKMVHAPRTSKDYSGWTRTYSYDEASCIAPQDGKAAVKGNRLSSTSVGNATEAYQYGDGPGLNGCMTSIPGYSVLTWDNNDKMRSFSTQKTTKPGVTPEMTWYVYDAQGRRVRKVTDRASNGGAPGSRIKDTRYLAMRDIFTTYRGDGSSISNKITTTRVGDAGLSGTPMAMLEHDANTGDRIARYQTSENLELDGAAQAVSYEEFSPYGASTYHARIRGVPRKHRFMSYERDSESGLYACGARYYAPWLGRWTSPDPIGTGDGLNVYAYVSNDPVNMNDHQGTAGAQKLTPGRTRYHSYSESSPGRAPMPLNTDSLSPTETFASRKTRKSQSRYEEHAITTLNPDHVFEALDRGKSNSALRLFESKVAGPGVPFVAAQTLRAHAPGADGALEAVGPQAQRYANKFDNMSPGMVRSLEHEFYFHMPQVERNTKSLAQAQQEFEIATKTKVKDRAADKVRTLSNSRTRMEANARASMDQFRREVAAGPPSIMSAVLEGLGTAGSAIANKFSLYYNDQPHESAARKDGVLGDADNHHSLSLHLKGDAYPLINFHVENKTMKAKSWFLRL